MIPSLRIDTRLRRLWMPALLALLLATPLAAQTRRHAFIHQSDRKLKDQSAHLASAAQVVPLTVDMKTFRSVASSQLHLGGVPLSPGLRVDLDLEEFNIIDPEAQLTSTGPNGVVPLPPTTVRLYRGKVSGDEKSQVYLALGDHSVLGSVTIGGKTYEISTDYTVNSTPGAIAANAYPLADVRGPQSVCGINPANMPMLETPISPEEMEHMSANPPADDEILYSVKGAFDADMEYLQLFNGNKQAAQDYMIELIGRVSAIFERDMSCQIVISVINIWETDQPYTESASMETALYQANQFWVDSRPNVTRGFVHIFSGKPWQNPIGIAFLDVLCLNARATAYSAITKTNPQRDIEVVAHENGHVFGSRHTHSCSWSPEIDRCAAADDGSCFSAGQVQQGVGTIMSYCAQKELVFHEKCANFIKNKLQNTFKCVEFSRRLTVRPSVIFFPETITNQKSDTTLANFYQNRSRQDVTVTRQTLSGKNFQAFTIVSPTPPFTLKPGEFKDISIEFFSATEDPAIANLKIEHDGLNPAIDVAVEAYAQDKLPVLGLIAGGEKEVDFKQTRVGFTIDTLVKNFVANNGDAPLRVTKTEIVGPDRFDFQVLEGTGPYNIEERGTRLDVKFRFTPKTPGVKQAYFRVESNSKFGADSVLLKGNVRVGPLLRLSVNELSVNFNKREKKILHDTNFTQFFYNAGSDTLQVIADLEGEDARSFVVNVNVIDLAPGESYDLPITLYDTVPGQKRAYLVINQIETEEVTIYRRDTVWLLAEITGPSSVPGEAVAESFSVAPNPTSGDAMVSLAPLREEKGLPYSLVITDVTGREVYRRSDRFSDDGARFTLDTDEFPAGVYYLRLQTEKGQRIRTLTIAR